MPPSTVDSDVAVTSSFGCQRGAKFVQCALNRCEFLPPLLSCPQSALPFQRRHQLADQVIE